MTRHNRSRGRSRLTDVERADDRPHPARRVRRGLARRARGRRGGDRGPGRPRQRPSRSRRRATRTRRGCCTRSSASRRRSSSARFRCCCGRGAPPRRAAGAGRGAAAGPSPAAAAATVEAPTETAARCGPSRAPPRRSAAPATRPPRDQQLDAGFPTAAVDQVWLRCTVVIAAAMGAARLLASASPPI